MGYAKEIITMDVYGDNKGFAGGEEIPKLLEYMEKVVPKKEETCENAEMTDVRIDVSEFFGEMESEKRISG